MTHSFPPRRSADIWQRFTGPRSSLRPGWCVSRVHHHQPRNRWILGFKLYSLHHSHLACWSTTGLRRPASIRSPTCRSEEQTSELQPLMSISYAVYCLTNKKSSSDLKPKIHI